MLRRAYQEEFNDVISNNNCFINPQEIKYDYKSSNISSVDKNEDTIGYINDAKKLNNEAEKIIKRKFNKEWIRNKLKEEEKMQEEDSESSFKFSN